MPYMMTDLAAGSKAVEQLQENVAKAPYIQDLTKAGAESKLAEDRAAPEETQLKLQQDRLKALYAPTEAATKQATDTYKLQEEMNRAKSAGIKALFDEANYKADTESTQKLQQWMQTTDGQTANDVQRLEKAAQFKAEAGLTKEAAALNIQVENLNTKEIANKAKELTAANESIASARALIKNVPDEQVADYIRRLPDNLQKTITNRVGEENWNKLDGKQKKDVLETLFQNAKQQVAMQVKEVEKEKAVAVAEEATVRSNYRADKQAEHKGKGHGGDSTKQDSKNFTDVMKIDERLEKDGAKKLTDFEKKVSAAEKVMIEQKAKWFNSTAADAASTAYTNAVKEKNDYAKQQLEKRIKVVESAPDYPGKQSYVDSLRKEMSLYGNTPIPVDQDKPAPAADKRGAEGKLEKPAGKSTVPNNAKTHDGYPARKNADGSYSTELSITVTNPKLNDGKPTNIPSLWKGKEVDENTAVENALASGKKYDSFPTIPEAVNAAKEKSKAGGANAPSNKPAAAKLTQAQNDAAITKANEAIKNGADPEKVKARLKEAGVSFKE
jgi:hypothetical protein